MPSTVPALHARPLHTVLPASTQQSEAIPSSSVPNRASASNDDSASAKPEPILLPDAHPAPQLAPVHQEGSQPSLKRASEVAQSHGSLCPCDFFCIEVGAGSAALSRELRGRGFNVVPLDVKRNRHVQLVRCIHVDIPPIQGGNICCTC